MSEIRYTASHEWVRRDGDRAVIGISNHAQQELGDVVYVELPAKGSRLMAGAAFGVVESVKAASDLFAPVSGDVAEVNAALEDDPGLVNRDAEGEGWMLAVTGFAEAEWDTLMSAADYQASL